MIVVIVVVYAGVQYRTDSASQGVGVGDGAPLHYCSYSGCRSSGAAIAVAVGVIVVIVVIVVAVAVILVIVAMVVVAVVVGGGPGAAGWRGGRASPVAHYCQVCFAGGARFRNRSRHLTGHLQTVR